LGQACVAQRRVAEADAVFTELATLAEALHNEDAALDALDGHAAIAALKTKMQDAIGFSMRALELRKKKFGPESTEAADNLLTLALMRWQAAMGSKDPMSMVVREGHILYELQYSGYGRLTEGGSSVSAESQSTNARV